MYVKVWRVKIFRETIEAGFGGGRWREKVVEKCVLICARSINQSVGLLMFEWQRYFVSSVGRLIAIIADNPVSGLDGLIFSID